MELQRDLDTGGQVSCLRVLVFLDLWRSYRVDLLIRQLTSPEVDLGYDEPIEMLLCPSDAGCSCGA
ncbi:unnamed protein product, partial [Vitis vinifera]|uniref:Uncharacterized protein n=1 Tax=Vitis vinifera TaxID=29760 RepID=D7SMZ1_VITVI